MTFGSGPQDTPQRAAVFNGRSSIMKISGNARLNTEESLTVMMDVYAEESGRIFQFGRDGVYLDFTNNAGMGEFLFYPLEAKNVKTPPVTKGKLPTKKWHHVAVTYFFATSEARLYLNGLLAGIRRYTPGSRKIFTDSEVTVGANFKGRISCFQVYEKALSRSEINRLKECPLGDEGLKGIVSANYFESFIGPCIISIKQNVFV